LYDWSVINKIFETHGHSISEVIGAIAEIIVDFVACQKDINYCYDYIYEIVYFYSKGFTHTDKNDVANVIIRHLNYLSDTKLDNSYIIDIWSGFMGIFTYFELFKWSDLNKFSSEKLGEEQLSCIFEVILKTSSEKDKLYNELIQVSYVQNNRDLFEIIFKGI